MNEMTAAVATLVDRTLLVLDDDRCVRDLLSRQLGASGFLVTVAANVAEALGIVSETAPAFAVMDLHLDDGTGLDVCEALHRKRPDARSVMLSGYGDIATAVAAARRGAADYLLKPAEPIDLIRALLGRTTDAPAPSERTMSPARRRWEHIERVFNETGRNRSETARRLGMHRRTLQRILTRGAPK